MTPPLQSGIPMSAYERLDRSRFRIVEAARGGSGAPDPSQNGKHLTGNGLLLEAARYWWDTQPLLGNLKIAVRVIDEVSRPIAQRAPHGLVVGAAVVGALLAWSRPWRWVAGPVLAQMFAPRMVTKVLACTLQKSKGKGNAHISA
jgi:hypothetical protein